MNSLKDAMYLVKEGYFFTSVDLKDAYYTLPLHVDAKKYFRFLFDSTLYEFNVLVMGYSDAPRIFTKVMSFLRDRGVMIVMYIDDALIVSPTEKQCQADTTATYAFWSSRLHYQYREILLTTHSGNNLFGVSLKLENTFNSSNPTETRWYNSCL